MHVNTSSKTEKERNEMALERARKRTVRDLRCILPNARSVQPSAAYHGHIDKLGAEIVECHIVMIVRVAAALSTTITIVIVSASVLVAYDDGLVVEPVPTLVPARLLHDHPAILRGGGDRVRVGRV